jgi:PhzF family phenazine biosynthesis protein
MSTVHPFTQVDVFTDTPLRGNPLAVVHAAEALSDAQMQSFARWTNLSETTFLLRPATAEADYRVRIFTPGGELPFAGHPTLGTCHAWLRAGGVSRHPGRVVQECGVGLVHIRLKDDGEIAFAAPPMRQDAVDDTLLQAVVSALGLQRHQVQQARWLDNGPRWLALLLGDAATVLSLEPDHAALVRHSAKVGVVGPCGPGAPSHFELRAFAAPIGIPEDPVTGSLNASVAQWLMDQGLAPERYTASQGARLDRAGRVDLHREGGTLWVGGHSVTCVRGELTL